MSIRSCVAWSVSEYMGGFAFIGCVSFVVGMVVGLLLATLIEGFARIIEMNYQI